MYKMNETIEKVITKKAERKKKKKSRKEYPEPKKVKKAKEMPIPYAENML